ncbi:MAG: sulfur transferase domain-containing protein [Roseiarcus sp.]
MRPSLLSPDLSASPQLSLADVAEVKAAGFRSILCDRPDGEAADQPLFAAIAGEAARLGLESRYVPIVSGKMTGGDVAAFGAAVAELPKPILAYCGSGKRVTLAAQAVGLSAGATVAAAVSPAKLQAERHDIIIVGGGAGGIAVAASMLARIPDLDIAIVEPADNHFYQPGWTLVGAGVFTPEQTRRTTKSVMPTRVKWIKDSVATFDPDSKRVALANGAVLSYRKLVVAPGLKLDWGAVEGLVETLGSNGVTSNYRFDLAPYTSRLVDGLRSGKALFTQPPMPIKCAGAPQKAMYLSCDAWRSRGVLKAIDVEFLNAGAALFGVADYVPPLMNYVKSYGITLSFSHNLIKVDGPSKTAWFKRIGKEGDSEIVERKFDMLHVVPPQCAPDFIRSSPLAEQTGWVEVDQGTLQHKRYPDIYSLGDAMSAPNAKTAAAIRKQAPIVAENLLSDLGRIKMDAPAVYDGYGACPLTVERGKIVMAEFGYGGKRIPTLPHWLIDDLEPSWLAWRLKKDLLPLIYWDGMLKGREWLVKPSHKRAT